MGNLIFINVTNFTILGSLFLGIRSFKRQLTKEEKKEGVFSFDENILDDNEDNEDVIKLKDDLGKESF